jgi:hypothetical protein
MLPEYVAETYLNAQKRRMSEGARAIWAIIIPALSTGLAITESGGGAKVAYGVMGVAGVLPVYINGRNCKGAHDQITQIEHAYMTPQDDSI